MSLRTKASLLLAMIVILSLGAMGFLYTKFLEDSLRNSISDGLAGISNTSAEGIAKFLQSTLTEVEIIGLTLPPKALKEKDAATIERYLKIIQEITPKYENGMFLLDSEGTLWADYPSHPETKGRSFAFREYYQRTMREQRGIVGVPYRSARTGEPVLTFTTLLKGESGQVLGLLGCSVQLLHPGTLGGIRKTKIGKTGYLYVYDTSRLMILHPEDERVLQRDVPPGANRLFDAAIEGFEGMGETTNSRGVRMLACFRRIAGTNWIIGAQQPASEAFAPIRAVRYRIFYGIVLAVLTAILIGSICIRRITEPLMKLRSVAQRLGLHAGAEEADFVGESMAIDEELDKIAGRDEIAEVALAFKEMSEKLDRSLVSIRRAARDWERTFDSVSDAVCIVDNEDRIVRLNRAAADLWKVKVADAIGRHCYSLMHGTDERPPYCPLERTRRTGEASRIEIDEPFVGRFLEITTTALVDENNSSIGAVNVAKDITDRKRAQAALEAERERLAVTLRCIGDGVIATDTEGVVVLVNKVAEQLTGWHQREAVGKPVTEIFHIINESTRERCDDPTEKVLRTGMVVGLANNTVLISRDGVERIIADSGAPVRDRRGAMIGVVLVFRDITNSVRAERERMRLATAIEQAAEGIVITGRTGTIEYVNPAFERASGYSMGELAGQNFRILKSDKLDQAFYSTMWKTISQGQVWSGHTINRMKDGRVREFETTISPIRDADGSIVSFVSVNRDVTHIVALEAQLRQAQKMEAVGTLAGGIAHDFNNLLQAIQGYAELLLFEHRAEDFGYWELQEICRAAQRGAELTKQLLTFSRKVESKLKPLNLNPEVAQIAKLLERTIPKMIAIQLRLQGDLNSVNADPTQIEQTLMNLAVNAKDAMPDGGTLTIETRNVVLHDEYCRRYAEIIPGKYVMLSVSDTGCGMESGTIEHIFDPFFTTKGVDKGTGLGLSMVYGIVKNHGGHIVCRSKPGKGTSFDIYFPAVELVEKSAEVTEAAGALQGGTETILVVDDDDVIRDLCREILTKFGYKVLTAFSGESALDIYGEEKDRIDLVILDLIMPGIGGRKCLEGLLEMDPEAKVILASGYSADGPAAVALKSSIRGFVNKPYQVKQILSAVREALDRKP